MLEDRDIQLNIKTDAKIRWIASLCAKRHGVTLTEFVERLILRGITREAMLSDEPRVSEPTGPASSSVLWNEALWSEDEATRIFNVATVAFDLLTVGQRTLWGSISAILAKKGERLTLNTFQEHYALLKGGA